MIVVGVQQKMCEWGSGQALFAVAFFGIELAVGDVVVLLARCELEPDLIAKLLVLALDQPAYLLHAHVVLLHARLVAVLDFQHSLRLLLLAGQGLVVGAQFVVIDGGLRLVLGLNREGPACSPDSAGEGSAVVSEAFFEDNSAALFVEELLAGLVPEGDEAVDALHLGLLPVLLLQLADQGLLVAGILVVVGVVEAVHAVGGAVGIVPNELFGLVEVLALDELLGLRVGRVRQNRLQVVVLHCRLGRVLHANKIMEWGIKIMEGEGSDEVEGEVFAESEVFVLQESRAVGHFLFDGEVDELLHYLLLPLARAPELLGDEDGLDEVLLLGDQRVDFLLAPEVVLDGLFGDGELGLEQVVVEALVVEVHQHCLLLVGNHGHELLEPLGEAALFALVVVGEVGVEVEGRLLLAHEEVEDLHQHFADFRVQLDVLLALLADFDGEEPQAVFYFFEAFGGEVVAHVVEGVEELEEADEAADDLDLEEALLLALVLVHVVVGLRRLHDDVHQLLDLQRHLQVLLLYLHEHARQLDVVLDLAPAEEAAYRNGYYWASRQASRAKSVCWMQVATIPSSPTRSMYISAQVFLPVFLNLSGQKDSQNLFIFDFIQERENMDMQSQSVIQSSYI